MTSGGRDSGRKGYLMQRKPALRSARSHAAAMLVVAAAVAAACGSGGSPLATDTSTAPTVSDDGTTPPEVETPRTELPEITTSSAPATTTTNTADPTESVARSIGPDGLPLLQPALGPSAVTVGESTTMQVSVLPRVDIVGDPVLTILGQSVELTDSDQNGDLVAGDRVFSASFEISPSEIGQALARVTAQSAEGDLLAGETSINVVERRLPTTNESGVELNIVTDEGTQFLADRIILIVEDDFDTTKLEETVASIGGTIVGFVGPGVWQVAVPAVETLEELEAYAVGLSRQPGVLSVEPEFASTVDGSDEDNGLDVIRDDTPQEGFDFGILGEVLSGSLAADPVGAVATLDEAEFNTLWDAAEGEPTRPLDGEVGVVANIGAQHRNPEIASVSGTDTWTIEVIAQSTDACNGLDILLSPAIAVTVDADSLPDSININITERPGCDG